MKKLLISFSGGETSAYMGIWLMENCSDQFEMIFVYANTGQENEETLIFIEKCSNHFKIPIVWVEADIIAGIGNGTRHKIVNFESADRTGKVFENFIAKYGIPNITNPQCSRELKLKAINSYAKSIEWKKYFTAVGIRVDEFDRMNKDYKKNRILYPLIDTKYIPTNKQQINIFWKNQPFRLQLKGYQGNCKWCWKKSYKKLVTIAKENPEHFDFPKSMEEKYGNFIPEQRIEKYKIENKTLPKDITFFRNYKSAKDILEESKTINFNIKDDSQNYIFQQDMFYNESCDIYSNCEDTLDNNNKIVN